MMDVEKVRIKKERDFGKSIYAYTGVVTDLVETSQILIRTTRGEKFKFYVSQVEERKILNFDEEFEEFLKVGKTKEQFLKELEKEE